MGPAQDVRALCHEVNAAKNDVLRILPIACPLGQFEGVSANICKLDDFITLVVMSEDHQTIAQASFKVMDPLIGLAVGQPCEVLRKNRLQHG